MNDYSSLSFWENRYTNEHLEIFEWYQTFDTLKEKIIEFLKPEDKILNVGSGTSRIAEDLFYEGYKNVTNIDFSEKAINLMIDYFEGHEIETKCIKMDVCSMNEFTDEQFNVVFDKALLDSMLCGQNAIDIVKKMITEIYRVLADDGYYIIVSDSNEATRKFFFDEKLWEYKFMEIQKINSNCIILDEKEKDPKNYHYIYVLKKKGKEKPKDVNPPVEEEKKHEKKGKKGKRK